MLTNERLELADELRAAAECKVGLDPLLERGEPELLETPDRGLRERLIRELGERRAAPQRERLAELLGRLRRLDAGRLLDEALEPVQVETRLARAARRSPAVASRPAPPPFRALSAAVRRAPAER